MNKLSIALSVLALFTVCTVASHAIPTGKRNESGAYLSGTGLPHTLRAGIYGGAIERDVKYGTRRIPLESKHYLAYLGVDIVPWLTTFIGAGIADHQAGSFDSETKNKIEAGVLLNLIDHVILDPTLFEDKLRVNAGASWTYTEAEWQNDNVRWQELTAFATVSIVNDTVGNKLFNPNSVAIYAGPLFNYIQSDELELSEELGFMLGLEIFMTESVALDLGIRNIDTTGFEGGLHIHF